MAAYNLDHQLFGSNLDPFNIGKDQIYCWQPFKQVNAISRLHGSCYTRLLFFCHGIFWALLFMGCCMGFCSIIL